MKTISGQNGVQFNQLNYCVVSSADYKANIKVSMLVIIIIKNEERGILNTNFSDQYCNESMETIHNKILLPEEPFMNQRTILPSFSSSALESTNYWILEVVTQPYIYRL